MYPRCLDLGGGALIKWSVVRTPNLLNFSIVLGARLSQFVDVSDGEFAVDTGSR